MMLEQIMQSNVIYGTASFTIADACSLMDNKRIRHLPIINESGAIEGILSDRDVRDASPSIFHTTEMSFLDQSVTTIMKTDVITSMPTDFVEDAATVMVEQNISCLPIERENRLVGIITETDLLKTLVRLTGADLPTSRLEVEVPNVSGMLSEVASLIKEVGVNVQSVLVYPSQNPVKKILVFRVQTMDTRRLVQSINEHDFTVLWPNFLSEPI
ncbi:acetoin utilization AcuB family protein [Alteribacter populi]|uniref:acetoin utilization AcuB family protein n=1 Tax=Alteribacter populi TaxID=2011011 RepID=UPI000BBAD68E|nr:acetoin utilization AcuB family protein [Alteribacter populi]